MEVKIRCDTMSVQLFFREVVEVEILGEFTPFSPNMSIHILLTVLHKNIRTFCLG